MRQRQPTLLQQAPHEAPRHHRREGHDPRTHCSITTETEPARCCDTPPTRRTPPSSLHGNGVSPYRRIECHLCVLRATTKRPIFADRTYFVGMVRRSSDADSLVERRAARLIAA